MTTQETREVAVLASFQDRDGVARTRGETFAVAYATDRQRQAVNQMVYRGFLTFRVEDVEAAGPEPAEPEKKPAAKRSATKKRASGES